MRVRTWLEDDNVKGLDDASMHAQMMRKAKDAERQKVVVGVGQSIHVLWVCQYFNYCAALRCINILTTYATLKMRGQDPFVGIAMLMFAPTRCGQSWNVTEG